MPDGNVNAAEEAARAAMEQVISCLNRGVSFVFEAGAGAGKTYSLVQSLNYLIQLHGSRLRKHNQRIACITYTNVAKDEIRARTDANPIILSETIHSFCWTIIKDFQTNLRTLLLSIPKWQERMSEYGSIDSKPIEYDLGYPKIEDTRISLGHDDVLALTVLLMRQAKFKAIFAKSFPFLLIDEYQDTNRDIANALVEHLVEQPNGILIGFFGDHWQRIYGKKSCGQIHHPSLQIIGKKANFRSHKVVVECLNRMRSELPQNWSDLKSGGSVSVFHTNDWDGERLSGGHWGGDLPTVVAHRYRELVKGVLEGEGWDFVGDQTKTLMLTHNLLADEQGYRTLANVFDRSESYVKKEDPYIAFFADVLEPGSEYYQQRRFGDMFRTFGNPRFNSGGDKATWASFMDALMELRKQGTIGSVINHLIGSNCLRLPPSVQQLESNYAQVNNILPSERTAQQERFLSRIENLKATEYKEVTSLTKFVNDKTPFATKHGVKGAEFENVLVVCGRGWNQYNFGQMLSWVEDGVPSGKQDTFERNRNLFYVSCSRPKRRLALLFTQELDESALNTLANWFGASSIRPLQPLTVG